MTDQNRCPSCGRFRTPLNTDCVACSPQSRPTINPNEGRPAEVGASGYQDPLAIAEARAQHWYERAAELAEDRGLLLAEVAALREALAELTEFADTTGLKVLQASVRKARAALKGTSDE